MDPNPTRTEQQLLRTTPLNFEELATLRDPSGALRRLIGQLHREAELRVNTVDRKPVRLSIAG